MVSWEDEHLVRLHVNPLPSSSCLSSIFQSLDVRLHYRGTLTDVVKKQCKLSKCVGLFCAGAVKNILHLFDIYLLPDHAYA